MDETPVRKEIMNPFTAAGGGFTFEQCVGATYLVSILAGDIPRGLDWGITNEVRFQQRREGVPVDDIVVFGTNGTEDRKLALQIKHSLTFSKSDDNFKSVIGDCWDTFVSARGWSFDEQRDRVGMGIAVYQDKLPQLQQLLEWARGTTKSAEFMDMVAKARFSSQEKRDSLQLIQTILKESKKPDLTDEELWRFLRCLVIIHYDLENEGSRDLAHMKIRLLDLLRTRDEAQASMLFDFLVAKAAKRDMVGGSINLENLKREIPTSIQLKDHPNYAADLERLRKHSKTVLDYIRDNIGEMVRFQRTDIVDEIETKIKENDLLVILGEPMVGKSAIMKLVAHRLMAEGQVLCFAVERFSGSGLETFLHNLNVTNDFGELLAAAGSAPLRCIFIDGLDKIKGEDKANFQ
jgi:hypothetical protein